MNPAFLHAVESEDRIDLERAEDAAHELLLALGEDPQRDGLSDTPRRIAAAYAELLTPEPFNATTFPNDEGYDELVLARDIPFHSLCEHHLLPFHGVAHVGYLPGDRIVGLSKLARVVDLFARRPAGAGAADEADRRLARASTSTRRASAWCSRPSTCACRCAGVQKPGTRTVTSALHGLVRDDPRTRQEFLALAARKPTQEHDA